MAYIDVVKREIKRFYNRPLIWTVSFLMPLCMCLLICMIFSKGSPTDLPVGVLDEDNSAISRLFIRNLDALPSCKIVYKVTDFNQGKQLLTDGKIYAFFAIPRHFQKDLYRMKQPQLLFYYNNQRILIGGIISKEVNQMVQTMMAGINVKMRMSRGMSAQDAVKQVNLIKLDDHIHSNPYFNYMYFLAIVAFGHIIQIHIMLTSVWTLGSEFKNGTSKDWLKSADNSIITAFLGKMTPYFIIFCILFLILSIVYFGILKAPFLGNIFYVILSTLAFLVACLCIGALFISINGNFRFALSNCAFYVAMGFAFAGVTFPTMSMPLVAKIYSSLLPLSYWIKTMINQSLRQTPVIYDIKNIVPLIILASLGLIALVRVKKLAQDEKRWYQL
ncbi:ABC transporter permease [bacterium]|nr:ABC transporter permease [bacterium]